MTLTRGKSKKHDPLVDSNRTYQYYNKILLIISSCKTMDQFKVVEKIIENFTNYCAKKGVEPDTYNLLSKNLMESLEYKARKT